MVVQPRVRNGVCLTVHPAGCAAAVARQIERARRRGALKGPRRVLVVGSSAGYGLASLITAAFGSGAATLGVSRDRPPASSRPGSAGWYNTGAFKAAAHAAGLDHWSLNGDAFAEETRVRAAELIKEKMGPVDLVIYSVAAGSRRDPRSGVLHHSYLKPIGPACDVKTLDFMTGRVGSVRLDPATDAQIASTVKVMGGEDWELWISTLAREHLLARGALTIAFSYVGSELTHPFYRGATIGRAKEHLEATADRLDALLSPEGGSAFVSVNKTIVTKAGAVIPGFALYAALAYRVMKDSGVHESAEDHIFRLFGERLYTGSRVAVDEERRIRLDELELGEAIQAEIGRRWNEATTANIESLGDVEGIRREFLNLFGFEVDGIDYGADVSLG